MFSTTNSTSTFKGNNCKATIIADTVSELNHDNRITTFELLYPRFIHSELMTHRCFSRNASSSRATPIALLISEARSPVFFDYVGKDIKGMTAGEELSEEELNKFKAEFNSLANSVADWVERVHNELGIHKQTLNRVLEPFTCIRTLVTTTDLDNFFKLRLAPDAQPEMRNLALAMKEALEKSKPTVSNVHAPYSYNPESSVARCARVSYGRLDGLPDDVEADRKLYNRLKEYGHMSPFEHYAVAQEDSKYYANLRGWASLRYQMEHE